MITSNTPIHQSRKSCCCVPCGDSRTACNALFALHKSSAWNVLCFFSSLLMIFGVSVAYCFPQSNETKSVIILFSLVAALIVCLDILLNILVNPEYFSWYCRSCPNSKYGNRDQNRCCLNSTSEKRQHRNVCECGSFYFWMDIIAVVSFVVDFYCEIVLYVDVKMTDERGALAPTTGQRLSWDYWLNLWSTIGKSFILARFFRSANVMEFSKLIENLRIRMLRFSASFQKLYSQPGVFSNKDGSSKPSTNANLRARRDSHVLLVASATKVQRQWRISRDLKQGNRDSNSHQYQLSVARGFTVEESAENSRVGATLRERTTRRVAFLLISAVFFTVAFRRLAPPINTFERAMTALHLQTRNPDFAMMAINVARNTAIPELYQYTFSNGTVLTFPSIYDVDLLRKRELVNITVISGGGAFITTGSFIVAEYHQYQGISGVVGKLFVILVWFLGVMGLAGPVMALVVVPLERMTWLLSMLRNDPLGYQTSENYKRFVKEEYDAESRYRGWGKEVLKGMETSFLQDTILRIGSLMRVGFGNAGVEIIRQNLLRDSTTISKLVLDQSGSIVNCIFLFCDIRQFTDATEALQEEVFVFTNKIALVVHSICNTFGGSANKNIGDAFLVTWRLGDDNCANLEDSQSSVSLCDISSSPPADNALYSVVKIRVALQNDNFFLKEIGADAKKRLLEKLVGQKKGPVVRMGFGLHAGKAVQGAIGSQRKIDPTYISEAVELSETLESLTKRYGLGLLMSNSFHEILSPDVRRRCRKVDRVFLGSATNSENDESLTFSASSRYCYYETSETMSLYTFDMDVDALHTLPSVRDKKAQVPPRSNNRRSSWFSMVDPFEAPSPSRGLTSMFGSMDSRPTQEANRKDALNFMELPPYHPGVWNSEEMRIMRKCFTDGYFYPLFTSALESYFDGDWQDARIKFRSILDRMTDGPSQYFFNIIESNNGIPYRGFNDYGDI